MYLSKVIIARAWSRDLYQLHQGLWHLFPNRPDAARDFLFHVEKRNTPEGCHVLLQSAQMPVSTAVATVIKTKQVEFQLRLVFHSIFGFGQIRSKLFSTIKSAWTVKGILNAVGFR